MEIRRSQSRETPRALVAGSMALLFLVQTLIFVFSTNGRLAFASGDAGASIVMAGEICHAGPDDSGKAPAQPAHHHHCTLCTISHLHHAVFAVGILASVIALLTPQSDEAPTRLIPDDLAPPPLGWTSSWSSQAPPSLS
jgi:hypothetical protein